MFVGRKAPATTGPSGRFIGGGGPAPPKMITAMAMRAKGVHRQHLQGRRPATRSPHPRRCGACLPYLQAQIEIIKPRVIVALGATAATGLLHTQTAIGKLRGQWTRFGDIPLMPTFHPAYLLRFPPAKRDAWNDLKSVLRKLGRPVPK